MTTYDAIILGAGHNGLILQAYLGKTGLKTLAVGRALLSRTSAGRRLLAVSALSPLEFVEQEFEHPTIKAGLLFFNGLREVDLRLKGFGHHIAALLASPAKAQMARGGSAALARALEAAVRETGGEIALGSEPKRILVEGGRAIGIETR